MGQKVNPLGIRLGITRDWTSKWYASKKQFPQLVHTDFLVRQFLRKKLTDASVSRVLICLLYTSSPVNSCAPVGTERMCVPVACPKRMAVMAIGLVGRKCGMTRIFTDAGESVPVTVVEVLANRVTQVKTVDHDGYDAVQVTFGRRRPQLLSKAAAGHFAKANVEPGRGLIEFRLNGKDRGELKPCLLYTSRCV